jgi:very-short-patch-repair endonuclease
MLWRDRLLAVELDGHDAHSTPAQTVADHSRQRALERRGFTVIRFDWDDVHEEPGRVAAIVRARLGP